MEFKILKGNHLATPIITKPWRRKVAGVLWFTEESVYDLETADQFDWNKVTGISFNPIRPDWNSLMVAWRYNVKSKLFEVSAFFNRSGERLTAEVMKTRYFKIGVNKPVEFEVDYSGVSLRISNPESITGEETIYVRNPGVKTSYLTSFTNNPWFGGNRPAPKEIKFTMILKTGA